MSEKINFYGYYCIQPVSGIVSCVQYNANNGQISQFSIEIEYGVNIILFPIFEMTAGLIRGIVNE